MHSWHPLYSGITLNFVHYPDLATVEKARETGKKTGVKLVVACPELKSEPDLWVPGWFR